MKNLITALLWCVCYVCFVPGAMGEPTPLGIRFLRFKHSGGFIEYEFRSNGNLIVYSYIQMIKENERRASGETGVPDEFPEPSFTVEFMGWKQVGDEVVVTHGGKQRMRGKLREENGIIHFGEMEATYIRVEKLQFFDTLFAETEYQGR